MDYLERLRQANSATKAQVSFVGALVATLVITGVWATTLPARFSPEKTASAVTTETEKPASASVWSGFGEAIKNQFASVFDAFEVPPELEETPLFDPNTLPPPILEEAPPIIFDTPTSSSTPTTSTPVNPAPVVIQISTTPTSGSTTATTSDSSAEVPTVSEPEPAPTPRVIMIATTTGSGTQTAP